MWVTILRQLFLIHTLCPQTSFKTQIVVPKANIICLKNTTLFVIKTAQLFKLPLKFCISGGEGHW